jgi:UPF0755 protein
MKVFLIIVLGIGTVLVGVLVDTFITGFQPALKSDKTPIVLDIPKGTSFNEITGKLYSAGLIRSEIVFKIYALFRGSAHRLQSGRYRFDYSVSVPGLLSVLVAGPKDIPILIFPGMTLKEIDDKLSQGNIINGGDLINYGKFEELKTRYAFLSEAISLEGFLLPDTYNFRQDSDIDSVIRKFLDNFENKAIAVLNNRINSVKNPTDIFYYLSAISEAAGVDKKNSNVLKLIIIASYLEREIPDSNERRIAAGIIEKRLKNGMPLQIDATILYNKCFGRFLGCPLLEKSDFKKDSPYNTYIHRGLTPTPIANPSLEAIRAAVEKKDSNYWFYLSEPKTQKTIFSENLEKHNINRAKYLLNNR